MKKFLAILLALAMIIAMVACGASDKAPAADDTGKAEDSSSADTGADAGTRDPYKIAYLCNDLSWVWNKTISDNFEKLATKYNYEYTSYACLNDFDAFINQIYTYADNGYDAFIIGADNNLAPRAYEVCKEVGVAFVAESTAFVDTDGNCIWPSVEQDQMYNGALCIEWLYENYKSYWGEDVDLSTLGLAIIDFSVIIGIHEREIGATAKFNELFPEASANYFNGDLVSLGSGGFSLQGANTMATTILSSNPQIEHWFVVCNVDDWAMGAARAVEALNMTDRVLVVSVQADAFVKEMESTQGNTPYVAAGAVSAADFSINMIECLITILDGKETAETIWPEWVAEGASYPSMKIKAVMITKDTYTDYLDAEAAKLA